jgi:hypothetical protein
VTKSGAVKFSAAFRLWRARLTHLAASARPAGRERWEGFGSGPCGCSDFCLWRRSGVKVTSPIPPHYYPLSQYPVGAMGPMGVSI